MSLVKLYDTTLRDGTQEEDISFLVEDKIRIAHKLGPAAAVRGRRPGDDSR